MHALSTSSNLLIPTGVQIFLGLIIINTFLPSVGASVGASVGTASVGA